MSCIANVPEKEKFISDAEVGTVAKLLAAGPALVSGGWGSGKTSILPLRLLAQGYRRIVVVVPYPHLTMPVVRQMQALASTLKLGLREWDIVRVDSEAMALPKLVCRICVIDAASAERLGLLGRIQANNLLMIDEADLLVDAFSHFLSESIAMSASGAFSLCLMGSTLTEAHLNAVRGEVAIGSLRLSRRWTPFERPAIKSWEDVEGELRELDVRLDVIQRAIKEAAPESKFKEWMVRFCAALCYAARSDFPLIIGYLPGSYEIGLVEKTLEILKDRKVFPEYPVVGRRTYQNLAANSERRVCLMTHRMARGIWFQHLETSGMRGIAVVDSLVGYSDLHSEGKVRVVRHRISEDEILHHQMVAARGTGSGFWLPVEGSTGVSTEDTAPQGVNELQLLRHCQQRRPLADLATSLPHGSGELSLAVRRLELIDCIADQALTPTGELVLRVCEATRIPVRAARMFVEVICHWPDLLQEGASLAAIFAHTSLVDRHDEENAAQFRAAVVWSDLLSELEVVLQRSPGSGGTGLRRGALVKVERIVDNLVDFGGAVLQSNGCPSKQVTRCPLNNRSHRRTRLQWAIFCALRDRVSMLSGLHGSVEQWQRILWRHALRGDRIEGIEEHGLPTALSIASVQSGKAVTLLTDRPARVPHLVGWDAAGASIGLDPVEIDIRFSCLGRHYEVGFADPVVTLRPVLPVVGQSVHHIRGPVSLQHVTAVPFEWLPDTERSSGRVTTYNWRGLECPQRLTVNLNLVDGLVSSVESVESEAIGMLDVIRELRVGGDVSSMGQDLVLLLLHRFPNLSDRTVFTLRGTEQLEAVYEPIVSLIKTLNERFECGSGGADGELYEVADALRELVDSLGEFSLKELVEAAIEAVRVHDRRARSLDEDSSLAKWEGRVQSRLAEVLWALNRLWIDIHASWFGSELFGDTLPQDLDDETSARRVLSLVDLGGMLQNNKQLKQEGIEAFCEMITFARAVLPLFAPSCTEKVDLLTIGPAMAAAYRRFARVVCSLIQ